ncbi:MAG: hypothetical protein QXG01_03170 [Candidatus Bathyarchaeia archaeon]
MRNPTSEEKNSIEKAATLIRELKIRGLRDAEKYEECEAIARLAPQEILDLIDDPQIKEGIVWLKEAHRNIPSIVVWRKAFAQTIQSLFKAVGGIHRIKRWHELEGICEEIFEEEPKKVDKNLREAIKWVKRIHNNSSKRNVKILRKIESEAELS